MTEDPNGMAIFVAVAEAKGFSAAGERPYAVVRPALEEVRAAVAAVGELSD